MKTKLPYLLFDPDRHGSPRIYVRISGRRIRIRELEGTTEFAEAYSKAVNLLRRNGRASIRKDLDPISKGTLRWLGSCYFASEEFKKLEAKSRRARRSYLEGCFSEPHSPSDDEKMGNCPISMMTPKKIKRLRDAKSAFPGAANNRLKHLSALFSWAVENDLMDRNPVREIKSLRKSSAGYHTWTKAEVEQFRLRHPVGTRARLALELLLLTGARRGDMVHFGKQHVRNGVLTFVPAKTKYKRMRPSHKPLLPVLAAVIEASPCGDLTFLVTAQGKPFTSAGFGNWFRERCDEAGLQHCTAHGLRKAGATIAAENGATEQELMAMFDWTTASQAAIYTRQADQKRLAENAMHLINPDQTKNIAVSHRSVAPKNHD